MLFNKSKYLQILEYERTSLKFIIIHYHYYVNYKLLRFLFTPDMAIQTHSCTCIKGSYEGGPNYKSPSSLHRTEVSLVLLSLVDHENSHGLAMVQGTC